MKPPAMSQVSETTLSEKLNLRKSMLKSKITVVYCLTGNQIRSLEKTH